MAPKPAAIPKTAPELANWSFSVNKKAIFALVITFPFVGALIYGVVYAENHMSENVTMALYVILMPLGIILAIVSLVRWILAVAKEHSRRAQGLYRVQSELVEAEHIAMAHKTRIMYIENKGGEWQQGYWGSFYPAGSNLTGPGRIGRVTFSKTGLSIYLQRPTVRTIQTERNPTTSASRPENHFGSPAPKNAVEMRSTQRTFPHKSMKMFAKNTGQRFAISPNARTNQAPHRK